MVVSGVLKLEWRSDNESEVTLDAGLCDVEDCSRRGEELADAIGEWRSGKGVLGISSISSMPAASVCTLASAVGITDFDGNLVRRRVGEGGPPSSEPSKALDWTRDAAGLASAMLSKGFLTVSLCC